MFLTLEICRISNTVKYPKYDEVLSEIFCQKRKITQETGWHPCDPVWRNSCFIQYMLKHILTKQQ